MKCPSCDANMVYVTTACAREGAQINIGHHACPGCGKIMRCLGARESIFDRNCSKVRKSILHSPENVIGM